MGKLDGRVALITGAARGIGKQIALQFAREGADVVLDDLLVDELEATSREVTAMGRSALISTADISTRAGAEELVQAALTRFGQVDILVNNAGLHSLSSLMEVSEAEWDAVHRVDLKGVFLCTQAVAGQMIERQYGKIINISSAAGLGGSTGAVAYAAAKAGAIQLTKSCARDLGPAGINVNCIAPGGIVTDMTRIGRNEQEFEAVLASRAAAAVLKRMGSTQDVAYLAAFLASDESAYISGQTIACDGGRMDRM